MRRHTAPHPGWLRGFWPDRNPLRRRCDRVEAVLLGALLAAFVVGAALAALAAGRWAHDSALHTRRAELHTWHQVQAVLLTAAAPQPAGFQAWARAAWITPNRVRHTGQVPAVAGSPAGTTVEVWVDAAGRQTGPPVQVSQVQGQTVLAGVVAVMAVALLLWPTGLITRCVTDRRRMAAWDAEWRATGPRWSHHG
jgi:hypothetical protein